MKPELKNDNDPILFDSEAHFDEQAASRAQVIDFTAHRLGTFRRALSHEVIYADNDDLDDDFDFALLAAGTRFR